MKSETRMAAIRIVARIMTPTRNCMMRSFIAYVPFSRTVLLHFHRPLAGLAADELCHAAVAAPFHLRGRAVEEDLRLPLLQSGGPRLVAQTGHWGELSDARFSADGRLVVTASQSGEIVVWDAKTGAELRRFAGRAVQLSSDNRWVLAEVESTAAVLWDLRTGVEVRRFEGLRPLLSPDCRSVLTIRGDAATLWSVKSGRRTVD